MRKTSVLLTVIFLAAAFVAGALLRPAPVEAQKKEIIQLQQDMTRLMDSQRELQRAVDEKHAVLKTLIEQSLDAVNKLSVSMAGVQRTVQDAQANSGARIDTMSTQVQALADNLEEVKVRLGRLTQQMNDMQGVVQSLDAKAAATAPPAGGGTSAPSSNTPPPNSENLYTSALRDYSGGKTDLARQQFSDYIKYFPDGELASNCVFYLGEILYSEGKFQDAVQAYDNVLDNYPKSFKLADARYKKAMALLELGQKNAAIRELREVVRRHPNSESDRRSRAKLRELGAAVSAATRP